MTSEGGPIECDLEPGEVSLGASFRQGYAGRPGDRALRSRKSGPKRDDVPLSEGTPG